MTAGRTATRSGSAAEWIATWFGCGFFPRAPGTAGSVGSIPLYYLVRPLGPLGVVAAAIVVTIVGVWSAGVVAREREDHDPQIVCIDEVAGMLVTLSVVPMASDTFAWVVAGFVLFRIFDSTKPWPCRAAERLPGGWGVVVDDLAAGVWAAAALVVARVALGV